MKTIPEVVAEMREAAAEGRESPHFGTILVAAGQLDEWAEVLSTPAPVGGDAVAKLIERWRWKVDACVNASIDPATPEDHVYTINRIAAVFQECADGLEDVARDAAESSAVPVEVAKFIIHSLDGLGFKISKSENTALAWAREYMRGRGP